MAFEDDDKKDHPPAKPPRRSRNFVFLLVIILIAAMLIFAGQGLSGSGREAEVDIADYLAEISKKNHVIEEVIVEGTDRGGVLIATAKDPGYDRYLGGAFADVQDLATSVMIACA